jgi:hypothetical protein
MAYKNKKKNKAHTQKLNKVSDNWRNVKRRKSAISKARINMKNYGLSEDVCEALLKQQGLI